MSIQDRFKLPPPEHEAIYKELEEALLRNSTESPNPRIAILGGQPGSGKTRLAEIARGAFLMDNDRIACINGDGGVL
ncbi:zeta toxin family protein, partial [Synergistaceae bacterium OttesenSCG-928-I11]|nr:zeta toxin family protein [Synergistaceae bacterium OttesenSCG-928-I11]